MDYKMIFKEGVASFTINRPHMRNAINSNVMTGFELFFERIEKDESIAFVVITGAGEKAFCSGGDVKEFRELRTEQQAFSMLGRMANILYKLATLPVPVIALVDGIAVGGGCEIATACDYRIMSVDTKAGFIQGTLAITTGWGGGTLLLEKGLPHDQAFRLLSEAGVHDAQELAVLGWASEVYEESAELGLAKFLKKMSHVHPSVHRTYKRLAIQKWNENNLQQRMIEEACQCAVLWAADAHHEAVNQFLRKGKK